MNARWFAVLAVIAVAVVGVLSTALRKPDRKGGVTVVVPRDLHDSGPVNQQPSRARGTQRSASSATGRSGGGRGSATPSGSKVQTPAQSPTRTSPNPSKSVQGFGKRRSPARKRKTPRTHPDRRPSRPAPGNPPQTTNPQPSPSQPVVTVPLPSICTEPIKVGNCP